MSNQEENYIFYYSDKCSNKNIGFSSSSNYRRNRTLLFTPNNSKMTYQNSNIKNKEYKLDNEKDNYLDFTDSESDKSFSSTEDNYNKDKKEYSDFHRNERISKTETLALFNKNYDILYNRIIGSRNINNKTETNNQFIRRPNRSISVNAEKLIKKLDNTIISNLNNSESINDFYEYTETCFEYISQLGNKPNLTDYQYVKLHIPNKNKNKKIALLDLDETLIHCIGEIKEDEINKKKCDKIIEVTLPSKKKVKIGVNIRPHLFEAMEIIQEKYNIVIFTASHSSYSDSILKEIDPENKYFKNRLYRNNCIPIKIGGKNFYVKDLDILKKYYNLKDIVIVDNSVLSFAYHINNGIPIIPFYDSKEDNELIILAYYLSLISEDNDLRKSNKIHLKLELFLQEAEKIIKGEEIKEKINDEKEEIIITELNTYIFMNEDNHEKRKQFIKLLNHYYNEYSKFAY